MKQFGVFVTLVGIVLGSALVAPAVGATSSVVWVTAVGGVHSDALVVDGVVYVGADRADVLGSGETNVYALDAATGEILWGTDIGGDVESSPTLVGGLLYVGSVDVGMYALWSDVDDDGVPDGLDRCPDTTPDTIDSNDLKQRHYAWYGGDTFTSGGDNDPTFTLHDAGGCSGEQIIDALGMGKGHMKFGLSLGAMRTWVNEVS